MKTTRDDLVIRAMALAHMVNAHTEFCVFVNYHGHVCSMDIRIAPSKARYNEMALQSEITTAYKTYSGSDAEIKATIEVLKRILQEQEIPFDDLEYTEELVREYTF